MSRISVGVLLLLAAMTISTSAAAGIVELTPFYGYRFGGDLVDYYSGDVYDLDGTEAYGLAVDIALDQFDETYIELRWSHQPTEVRSSNPDLGRLELGVDYFHIGGIMAFGDHYDNFMPYGVGTLGATHFNPEEAGFSSATRFSFGLGGGIKMMFAKRVGVRLEGRMLGTFISSGSTLICGGYPGYPGNCYYGVRGSVLWQGEITAGLVFALGSRPGH